MICSAHFSGVISGGDKPWRTPVFGNPPGRTASSSRVRYLLVFWPVTGTGDLSDGTMVFVSFYKYWPAAVTSLPAR